MSSRKVKSADDSGNATCVVCYKNAEIYSIGLCDHAVCFECSTRMRVLCDQKECPICRTKMPQVIFTREVKPFTELKPNPHLYDKKIGLAFCSHSIQEAYLKLLDVNCSKCSRSNFRNFGQLKDHMRKEHELYFCELCENNLKIFPFERRCYTRAELATHRRKGDQDNKSHRGHPLCEFCDVRYMDNDELFRHLRIDHFYCHFCDMDGKHQYYPTYDKLRDHFAKEHYLCEDGTCRGEQFTSVFRTEIDLKAHKASVHSKELGRAASKHARTLEVEFNFNTRRNQEINRNRPQSQRFEDDDEGAVGYNYMDPGGPSSNRNTAQLTEMDFPQLGNGPDVNQGGSGSSRTASITFTSKINPSFSGEDFPTLGGASASRPNVTVNYTKNKKTEDFPILGPPKTSASAVNGRPESSKPSTGTSTVKLTLNQARPASRSNVTVHLNNQNGTVTTRISTAPTQTRPRSEAFPALGTPSTAPSAGAQWVVAKTKKPQEPRVQKTAPAPALPPSSLDFPTLGSNKKTKKSSEDWWDDSKSNGPETKAQTSNKTKVSSKKNHKEDTDSNGNNVKAVTKKTSKLNIGTLSGTSSASSSSKPPPGISVRPPPGFASNDLTFMNSSGESFAIRPHCYVQPKNFAQRNANLISSFVAVLNAKDKMREFKNFSDLFRRGTISADKYYEHCECVLQGKFDEVFPELLVLLPDISKQQELYSVYKRNRKNVKKLEECATCKQVVFANELKQHLSAHYMENHFPNLQTNVDNNNGNCWRK